MGKKFCIAAAVSSAIMIMASPAAAISYEDIAGKWCSEFGSEQFSRDSLIVTRAPNGERSVYPIVRYDYQGTEVQVFWRNSKGDEVNTSFGEFSGDGRRMMQLETKESPPIPHHRC